MPIGPNGPDYTDLDYPQVLQRVFEEAEDRLRVDAEVTAVLGTVEVIVTDTNDSIKIGNGLGVFADVDAGRNLTVIDVAANTTLSSIDSQLSAGITVNAIQSGVWSTGRTWVLDNSTDSVESFQGGSWSVGINNFPATQSVTQGTTPWIVDGSGFTQPVSGTVTALQGTSPWVVSGTVAATQSGTWNIGTLSTITNVVHVDDNGGSLTVDGTVTALQGTSPWVISGTVTTSPDVNVHDGTGISISSTGSSLNVNVTNTIPVSQSGAWTVTANQGTSPWVISGTVAATQSGVWSTGRTWTLSSGTDSVASVQSGTWVLGANSGVDIGDVTINNTAGAGAVNIQDGGNSITVDGTVTVLQGTSPWVVSGTVTTTTSNDTNYGVVGANTLRTAAQIGNATGAADFGAGTTTAQTLRVVLPTDQTAIPVTQSGSWTVAATQSGTWTTGRTWTLSNATDSIAAVQSGTWNIGTVSTITNVVHIDDNGGSITVDGTVTVNQGTSPWVISGAVTLPYDTNYGTVGAATLRTASQIGNSTGQASFNYGTVGAQTLRVASQIGNATGAADFNAGTTGAQTLRTTANITRNGTELDYNYGTVGANTLRTASQIGNATGAADFNAGATGAQTLRVTANAGVNLNTSALALDTTVAALQVTQGSTTAGQSGTLVQGAVTTGAPTYTTGQTRPLSLTTGGALRVDEVGFSTAGNTRPAITNASSTVLAANLARKYVYISNQSGVVAYLKLGATAVINEGIRLPNNSIYEITKDNLWLGTIQAIKSGAASVNLDIFEGTP